MNCIGWFIERRLPEPTVERCNWKLEASFWPDPDINKFFERFHVEVCDVVFVSPVDFVYPEDK